MGEKRIFYPMENESIWYVRASCCHEKIFHTHTGMYASVCAYKILIGKREKEEIKIQPQNMIIRFFPLLK